MRAPGQFSLDNIVVGPSARMRAIFDFVKVVSRSDSSVIITGESGTGKEVIANVLHHSSPRRHQPFVAVSCALFSENLIETELFGHERGAFTGAIKDKPGRFEMAQGGTLFLDDIDDVPLSMQVKLLRAIQNRTVERVGGTRSINVNVRVITGTKKDLKQMVAEGKFREDLFYRLNVLPIVLPPLRERREDIPLLIDHFLQKHSVGEGRRMSPEAMALLVGYAWPGNVRELENEVLRVAALAGRVIQPRDLSPHIAGGVPLSVVGRDEMNLKVRVEHLERELLQRALQQAGGNHTQAALRLGLSRFGLLKKLRRYGFDEPASGGGPR